MPDEQFLKWLLDQLLTVTGGKPLWELSKPKRKRAAALLRAIDRCLTMLD